MKLHQLCVVLVLLAATALGSPRKKHHRRVKEHDGEFANFANAVEIVEAGGYGKAAHGHAHAPAALDHVIEDTNAFDPRLPDPPCVWTTWSACDAACDGGSTYRLRRITDECEYGPAEQLKACNVQPCPSDCTLGEWASWGCCGCSAPCGGGQQTRSRPVISPALFGGRCDQDLAQTESCNLQACPTDCVATSLWSEWGPCDAACGGGRRTRARDTAFVIVVRAGESMSEAECPESQQDEPCGEPCPIDCLLSEADWSQWSVCSATCGTFGDQTRHRAIEQHPQNGGNECPPVLEVRPCEEELPECPQEDVPIDHSYKGPFTTFRGDPIILPPIANLPPVVPVQHLPPIIPATTTELSVDPKFCVDKPDGPYEHPDCACCNDLIMCFQRAPILKWCPPGEVFVGGQYSKCLLRSVAPGCA